ncbi:hypothetical protein [Sphaerisporangium sp. TRM90804]|uniref:hypothetical protein n=1 Tax=Sphaerisporangium sp. TRM90804 TaxID=3031113 RepID=UPI00244A7331|nr:hypothetical protein [Sphaerisporangium sp. TRM90804]MDH2424506.1 hypothetical protein [Sphaerisporangium sp. TRM90804]
MPRSRKPSPVAWLSATLSVPPPMGVSAASFARFVIGASPSQSLAFGFGVTVAGLVAGGVCLALLCWPALVNSHADARVKVRAHGDVRDNPLLATAHAQVARATVHSTAIASGALDGDQVVRIANHEGACEGEPPVG